MRRPSAVKRSQGRHHRHRGGRGFRRAWPVSSACIPARVLIA